MKTKPTIEKQIIEEYNSNDTKIKDISQKYNISRQTIRKIILRNGIKLKTKKISKKVVLEIINKYQKGIGNKILASTYGLHRGTIQQILKKNNIPLKSLADTARKKHLIIDFKNIDTNEKSYILGFLFADGNLYKNAIEISLIKSDAQILKDISKVVYGKIYISKRNGRIYKHKNSKQYYSSPQCRFYINCQKLSFELRKFGLMENKSLKIRFPKLKKKFISHFIRGYFDGDGCIFVSKKYKNTNRVTMVSNYLFCEDLKYQIEKFLKINACVQYKTENVGTLSISGNKQIITFMDWIYQDANLKLNRKYQKYITELKNKK